MCRMSKNLEQKIQKQKTAIENTEKTLEKKEMYRMKES